MPEIIYRPINSIKPLSNNPRQITAVDFERLCRSVEGNPDYFEARPLILSDRTGELVIIAGNMRHKAAKKLKLKQVPTILLPDLTEEREREIIIRDNVNNGSFDWDALSAWDDLPLSEWGVDIPEDWTPKETFDFFDNGGEEDRDVQHGERITDSQNGNARFPLAIVLNQKQVQAWRARKEEMKISDDTKAFLQAVEL